MVVPVVPTQEGMGAEQIFRLVPLEVAEQEQHQVFLMVLVLMVDLMGPLHVKVVPAAVVVLAQPV